LRDAGIKSEKARQKGMSAKDILWQQLAKYPPLAAIMADRRNARSSAAPIKLRQPLP